jgi:hypothetical protein
MERHIKRLQADLDKLDQDNTNPQQTTPSVTPTSSALNLPSASQAPKISAKNQDKPTNPPASTVIAGHAMRQRTAPSSPNLRNYNFFPYTFSNQSN